MAAPGGKARIKGLRNLFLASLTTDTSTSTVYGTGVSLGAQSKLTFQPVGKTADLETSFGIENSDTLITHCTYSADFGELNLDAVKIAMAGKRYSDSPNGKDIFAFVKGMRSGYFGLFGQPLVTEGGPADHYVGLMKCKWEGGSAFDLDMASWAKQSISGRAFYTLKDGLLFGMANLTAITDVTASIVLTDLQAAITSGT